MTALLTPPAASTPSGRRAPALGYGYRHIVSSPAPPASAIGSRAEAGGPASGVAEAVTAPYIETEAMDLTRSTTMFLADLMKPGEFDRRAEETSRANRPALLAEVMIPEDTFRPHALEARVLESSHRGIKLFLEGMRKDLYRRMIHKQRLVRLSHGTGEETRRLTGRITWFAFHQSPAARLAAKGGSPLGGSAEEGRCFCFVSFDGRQTDGSEALALFLQGIPR